MALKAERVWAYKAVLDGFILEGVVWRLPQASDHFPHSYKYRLFLGRAENGACLLRYDNERGKGDHSTCRTARSFRWTSPAPNP